MLAVNLEFPHSYEISEVPELPGIGKFPFPVYNFPRLKSSDRGEQDGIWLMVKRAGGEPWIGVFAIGGLGHSTFFTGAVATPDPDRLCVIAHGNAYLVHAGSPDDWEQIPFHPVRDVRPLVERKLVLFSDFVGIAGYGENGLVWRSPRLCWDDLKIDKITAQTIEGTGYDPTNATEPMRFVIDINSGQSLVPPLVSIDGTPIW